MELLWVVQRIFKLCGAKGVSKPGSLPCRTGEEMRIVADSRRTENLTKWRALVALEEGLRDIVQKAP